MKKQEIKRAVDLISHFYSSANWYERKTDIAKHHEKAFRERCRADAIELLMIDSKLPVVVHKDTNGSEYAVSTRLDEEKIYIRWVSSACHPWDEISFDYFKEEVAELKDKGYRVFTTNGSDNGMNEL